MTAKDIIIASHNSGKLSEFSELFRPAGIKVIGADDIGLPQVEESGHSLIENAILKARSACYHGGQPAIGDDSGLEVDALNGAPGIYSARYAGTNASAEDRINKLLAAMKDVPATKRQARFCCALAYLRHADDPVPVLAYGFCCGMIAMMATGKQGFGYDPIVYLADYQCTVAELDKQEKNKISHRAQAVQFLIKQLKSGIVN